MQIQAVLKRDLTRRIEEIIQLDQLDEEAVYTEITEYVATESIRRHYRELLEAINASRTSPTEGVGVWVSGFFGSGKSSFAKNLGYVLANRKVLGHSAPNLLKSQLDDPAISSLIDLINSTIPIEVVMFDVQKHRAQAGQGGLSISPYVYRVLLGHLGYAEDFDIAELEISLEEEGRLEDFISAFNRRYAAENQRAGWIGQGRKSTQTWNRAGVILHELYPDTYKSPDSFAEKVLQGRVQVTPILLVDRAFELMERRRPGKTLALIVDEVGQYVAYSQERLEDLRAIIETFGAEGRNRVRARKAIAPVWFVVTAQERLEDVTSAMGDDRRVLFAKVQDRFPLRIDLSPADVREVAARRVLIKTPEGAAELRRHYRAHEGQLNAACRLERTTRPSNITEDAFIDFYPYLPHYVDLSIDIMAGIRLQPGAMRHIGGSNRTIISQVYQMLVNPRTAYAQRELGALVSIDQIYELIEGQVGTTKQKDLVDVAERFRDQAEDAGWAARVAKAIALLEFVRDLPRTESNIAALLVDRVGQPRPEAEVKAALARLEQADFVRSTDQGYKLQTAQEKSWEQEKRGFQPKPRDQKEIEREVLGDLFGEPSLKSYRYKGLRTFSVGVAVDGARIGAEGQIALSVLVAEDEGETGEKRADALLASRNRQSEVYWVFTLTREIDDLVAGYYAAGQMIAKYQQIQAQNKITNEEAASLAAERHEHSRLRTRLRDKLAEALASGQGVFRGVTKDASDLGRTPAEIFRGLYEWAVPDLYPKLELGTRPLTGKEPDEVLRATNLQGLAPVFYGGDDGLGLIAQDGTKYVVNAAAPIAKEVLDYLRSEHSYGNRVTGKSLEQHFGGQPYGWELDAVKLVLATLLRGGSVEVTHQGRRHRDAQDPQSRTPFASNVAFRAASFAPKESVGLKMLVTAANQYEALTGKEIDPEEGTIATAFKALAAEELNLLLPVIAEAKAHRLPVSETLDEYRLALKEATEAEPDDAVKILAGEGITYREARETARRVREVVTPGNLQVVERARSVINQMWPALQAAATGTELAETAAEVTELLKAPDLHEHLARLDALARLIGDRYRAVYEERHAERAVAYRRVVSEVTSGTEWATLPEEQATSVLQPLSARACGAASLPAGTAVCPTCQATLSQMESDLAALAGLRAQVETRVQELSTPEQPVERVKLATFFDGALDSTEAVTAAVERLREHLLKLVAAKARVVVE